MQVSWIIELGFDWVSDAGITIKTIQTQREREKQVEDYFKKNERR